MKSIFAGMKCKYCEVKKMYRILIIEDDDIIAKNIATHFKRWNYETMQIIDFKI